jgi:hypothetical protein
MNALVGAWRLVSTVSETEEGEVSNLGTNPGTVGYLIYSADGHTFRRRIAGDFAADTRRWYKGNT